MLSRQIPSRPPRGRRRKRPLMHARGNSMNDHPLAAWHRLVGANDPSGLDALLADDAVFHSPVVHTPQRGKALTAAYLGAAFHVFFNPSFRYVREIVGESDAMLEFETEIDGVQVNGVDLIRWNASGRIAEFKVMIRPLKAVNLIHAKMAEMLQARAPGPIPPSGTSQSPAP
jgi:hypothetical protein